MFPGMLRLTILGCVSGLVIAASTGLTRADDGRSIALVLDASGSMRANLPDGASRMDAAKAAVEQLVGTLPESSRLSFWAYGHQSPREKKDCKDIALLAPFDSVANNDAAIVEQTRGLQPQGYTPITDSLRQAAEGLAPEEAASHVVVLVSDGKETCQADPCAAAKALAEADAKLVVHTVGVGVDTTTRMQLECISNNARGNYFDANSAADLEKFVGEAAVQEAAAEPPAKKVVIVGPKLGKLKMELQQAGGFVHYVVNDQGKEVADFAGIGREVELPAGVYGVTFPNGVWTGIDVKAGETTEIKPGYLEIEPRGSDFVHLLEPETGEKVAEYPPAKTLIPGRFDVRFGNALWPGGVELKPGETLTLKPGVVVVQKSSAPVVFFVVKSADGQEAAKGNTGLRIALPPGKYVVELDMPVLPEEQRKVPVELAEGQEVEINLQ